MAGQHDGDIRAGRLTRLPWRRDRQHCQSYAAQVGRVRLGAYSPPHQVATAFFKYVFGKFSSYQNMASRIVRSFRAQAVMASFGGFPAVWSQLLKALKVAARRGAMKAARKGRGGRWPCRPGSGVYPRANRNRRHEGRGERSDGGPSGPVRAGGRSGRGRGRGLRPASTAGVGWPPQGGLGRPELQRSASRRARGDASAR